MTEPYKTITNIFRDQTNFMLAGSQTVDEFNPEQKLLYQDLIVEEYDEFIGAITEEPLSHQIKEACDILVVVAGWLNSIGIDAEVAWRAVHSNNMLKVAYPPVKDKNGKIKKSDESRQGKKLMMTTLDKMCQKYD